MAMTLRIDDELDKRLRDYAQRSGLSKQRIVLQSIDEFLTRAQHSADVDAIFTKVVARDQELLDRLADA